MAGMPWEDYSSEGSAEETGPWADFSQEEQPVNLATNQTLTGGFSKPGEQSWVKSEQPSPQELAETAPKQLRKGDNPYDYAVNEDGSITPVARDPNFNPYLDQETGVDTSSFGSYLKTHPFFGSLKNPWQLWTEESLPAHAYNAYKKGTFEKPMSELVKNVSDEVKAMSVPQIWEAAKANPGRFSAEFINSVVADPELLLAPIALGGKVATAAARFGKTAQALGYAAETGIAAGAISAPISIAEQLDKKGYVNPVQLGQDIGVNATFGAALGGVLGLAGHMKTGKIEVGSTPQDMAASMKFNMQEGDDIMTALNKAMEEHGVPADKSKELLNGLEETIKTNPDLEADFLKMREDLNTQNPTEPLPITPDTPDLESYIKTFKEEQQTKIANAEDYKTLSDSLFKEASVEGSFETPAINHNLKQAGIMDPELAKYIALTGAGAAAGGYWADDKPKGMAIGAALALGGAIGLKAGKSVAGDLTKALEDPVEKMFHDIPAKKTEPKSSTVELHSSTEPLELVKKAKEFGKKAKEQRDQGIAKATDDLLSRHEGIVASTGLASDRLSYTIKTLVPNAERRGELIHYIQEGRVPELTGNERIAAEVFQKEMAEAGDFAQKTGLIDNLINDGTYVTQLWKDGKKAKSYYSSVSPTTRFAEDRLIPSYKEGMALGLEPKTLDLAEIAGIYGKSIGKSIANKTLLDELKTAKLPNDLPMLAQADKAPLDYVQIDHPQLRDLRVNPEMAPSLSHAFSSNNIPAYLKAMTAVSSTAKRGLFSFSGFHIKSLLDVATGLAVGTGSPSTLTKIPSMYKMIKEGKAGDFADQMIQAGLKIEPHSGIDMDNDVFKNVINAIEAGIKSVPGGKVLASPITAIKKLDAGMQFILWDYLHPAMKLAAANTMYEKALLKQADTLNKNPGAIVPSAQATQREIAQATNDLFGGLNWRKISDDVQTKWLHDLSASITNPQGLRVARVALLAPDWTVATARAGYKGAKAIAKTLTPGAKISVADDMYRRYFLGSALLYATIADGLNVHFSGKHFWENEDPTYVDLGDGRKLQLSKHFMEPFHWIQHPGQALINKMGYLPKEFLQQSMSKEYLTARGGPPMKDPSIPGRALHALGGMAPITTQQTDPKSAALGFVGLPVYGKTKQEKELEKRKRVLERKMKARKLKAKGNE